MQPLSLEMYDSPAEVTWCPGCGDFAVLRALKMAFSDLGIAPHEALLVSGIGCGSKIPDYMTTNGFMTIHGRPLAIATGAKLANPELKVVVVNGDGDSYGIGGNHFVHTCRRNPDITHIVENNQIYGLTKGQYSPTSQAGTLSNTSPDGSIEAALNPMAVALAAGAKFIARSFAGEPRHVAKMVAEGIKHHGYALIDVLQPCLTFNHVNSYDWYRERAYHLEDTAYDPSDRASAWAMAEEWGERIPIGILYQEDGRPTYEEQVTTLRDGNPVSRIQGLDAGKHPDYERLKEAFL